MHTKACREGQYRRIARWPETGRAGGGEPAHSLLQSISAGPRKAKGPACGQGLFQGKFGGGGGWWRRGPPNHAISIYNLLRKKHSFDGCPESCPGDIFCCGGSVPLAPCPPIPCPAPGPPTAPLQEAERSVLFRLSSSFALRKSSLSPPLPRATARSRTPGPEIPPQAPAPPGLRQGEDCEEDQEACRHGAGCALD